MDKLNRKPFDAQQHAITAALKALARQRSIILVGEMGTGKTLMGMASAHAFSNGRPYHALVFCPGQLCKKWEREIKSTIAGACVKHIHSIRDLFDAERQATHPTWWIVSRDRAKLGARWRPAVIQRKNVLCCPACMAPIMDNGGNLIPLEKLTRQKHFCNAEHEDPRTGVSQRCRNPLWQYTREINRWEPARYIQRRMKGFFKYLILDEVHEEKGANTAQGNAAGALASACEKTIALTGTLIGGYAEHLRPLLFRLCPKSLVEEGFSWDQVTAFSERYGRIETKIVEKEGGLDNRNSRGRVSKTKSVRPGIMPTLFGRHLIGNTIFLGLEEVADNLPQFEERVEPVSMDSETAGAYRKLEMEITTALKPMVARGDRRLLAPMLQALLAYPDHPYDWEAIGYWDTDKQGRRVRFNHVAQPRNLSRDCQRPKEEHLLDLVQREAAAGRQCWVYVQLTDKRDVAARLKDLFINAGLNTEVLRASVAPAQREEWIAKHAPGCDVVISHPRLVETGLDLFDVAGRYNFTTLIFYETGYNLFTLRQAARRSWRIGQRLPCRVYYLFYGQTMQERAMTLMGRKLSAAQAIDGKFSADGLAALADEDGSVEMALAKSLAEQLDDVDARRAWDKLSAAEPAEQEEMPVLLPLPKRRPVVLEPIRQAGFLFAV